MFFLRFAVLSLGLVMVMSSHVSARSILEKKVWYVTSEKKIGQARFWTIFLGNHDCNFTRKLPGEPEQEIAANMNFQLLSSGYLEGNGYSAKGKMEALPVITIRTEKDERKIEFDSIDYLFEYGQKLRTTSGEVGEFIIDAEGQKLPAKRFLLREYKLEMLYGEEILKPGSDEIQIAAIAFSKEGAQRALKEIK